MSWTVLHHDGWIVIGLMFVSFILGMVAHSGTTPKK